MYQKLLATVNERYHMLSPANPLLHYMLTSQELMNSNNDLQHADLKLRSRLSFTHEESSHWASLMARYIFLGPSDVPCSVETSTAHGESSFWELFLTKGKDKFSGIFATISDRDHSRILPNRSSPEMASPLQTFSPSSTSGGCNFFLNLGFRLEGLVHKLGPLISIKPKSIKSINHKSAPNAKNTRSGPITLLLSFQRCLCRFHYLTGRRLQLREKPHSLRWLCNMYLRILVVSLMIMVSDSKILKIYNHRPIYITLKIWNQSSQEAFNGHRKNPDLLICALKQSSLEYAEALLRFLPSTSSRLLTMTSLSSNNSIVDDLSTNRDLTCAGMLFSFCLKALMESMSIYLIYLLMALGNASLSYVLNLILESSLLVFRLF